MKEQASKMKRKKSTHSQKYAQVKICKVEVIMLSLGYPGTL